MPFALWSKLQTVSVGCVAARRLHLFYITDVSVSVLQMFPSIHSALSWMMSSVVNCATPTTLLRIIIWKGQGISYTWLWWSLVSCTHRHTHTLPPNAHVCLPFLSRRPQYQPLSLKRLQYLIDLGRVDPTEPIDLTQLVNARGVTIQPLKRDYGVQLVDEVTDWQHFKS